MASAYHLPVTAAQVGAYFVGQYYHILQQQPELIHQFYSDSSTMLRVDRAARDTATAMPQIHTLVMSLNFTGIEIMTAHSLESWSGGVLVMVTGSVLLKDMRDRRKFVQTFFLGPQEKGFFVLNDIFQFIDDEPVYHHHAAFLGHSDYCSNLNASLIIPEPVVPTYEASGEIQGTEFAPMADAEENGADENNFPEQRPLTQFSDANVTCGCDNSNVLIENATDHQTHCEESSREPHKQTYASIAAKGRGSSTNKNTSNISEWHEEESPPTPKVSHKKQPDGEVLTSKVDEELHEIKSVYVRNLPPIVTASEVEEEFKKFGDLKPGGIAIRNRKDVGACYAFVEFEDISGVHNAVKAGTVHIAGRPAYVEERRATTSIPYQYGRRGRGRANYQNEGPRGRYGGPHNFRMERSEDRDEWAFHRPKGNGFYRPGVGQDPGRHPGQHRPNPETRIQQSPSES